MISKFTRAYLFFIGLFFYLLFGALFIVDPAAMFERIGMSLGSAMTVEEVRASHGGVWFLTGLLCLAAVWRASLVKIALIFLLLFNGGYAIGRIASFVIGSVPAGDLLPLFAFDVVLVAISALLLIKGAGETS